MSGDDFSDFDENDDDDFLQEIIEKTDAVNRYVSTTTIVQNQPVQRTLTGERIDDAPARYEEIHTDVTFHPTHHDVDRAAIRSYIYPSNYEVRDYQFDIIRKALFKNILCAIPTGMGKTFVASTVMLNYYRWFRTGKIIFMAPTRPLVAQQIQACLGVTDIPSSQTAILLDKTRKNRPEIWNSKRVFFTTPQVVENDLKAGSLNPKEIVCVVIDEAHRARGNYAYTNVVKFIDRFNTSFRVLALTATPAADIEGVQDVVNNLNISQIEIRTEESMDIQKFMKRKDTVRIQAGMNNDMEQIVELLCIAIDPVLKQANEANIYEVTDPYRINAFQVMQKSQAIVKNPSIPEGPKWKYFFILQVIGYVGQMLRRLKIYGVRTFYSYYQNKCKEFKTKYALGKSTNKTSASFFYHEALKGVETICDGILKNDKYVSHPKLEHMIEELTDFFDEKKDSRVIIFTELRESALEIVKCIDSTEKASFKPHIFIGQSRAKEPFDEDEYKLKNTAKGRGKKKKAEREDLERELMEEKEAQKKAEAMKRAGSRSSTSEEAQIQGMNQKTQKELITKFKKGHFNILVATSIGEEGLDIGEVDLIICYDSTSSPIKNIQRMGRTGRKNDGKVILLLSSNEETKFERAMEEYSSVQKQIAKNALDLHVSDRILPKDIEPVCEKKLIEIPEDNLIIARGQDEDEVIKFATQAMLGKNLPGKRVTKKQTTLGSRKGNTKNNSEAESKIKKKFFMPDNVTTGFVNTSTLVRKIDDTSRSSIQDSENDWGETSEDVSFLRRTSDTSNSFGNQLTNPNSSVLSKTGSSKKRFIPPVTTDLRPKKNFKKNNQTFASSDEEEIPQSSPLPEKLSGEENQTHVKTSSTPYYSKILNFEAYEDDKPDLGESSSTPYHEAEKAMRKQYDEDPSFDLSSSVQNNERKKTSSVQSEKKNNSKNNDQSNAYADITRLLKENTGARKNLGVRRKRVDISSVRPSQIIDLDSEVSQRPKNFKPLDGKQAEINKSLHTGEKDRIFKTTFDENEGFLTTEQSNEFFSFYYTPSDISFIEPNPTTAAKSDAFGKINASSKSQRFKRFISLCGPRGERKMKRLINELNSNSKLDYDENIKSSDIVVNNNEIEYVTKPQVGIAHIIEDDAESDVEITDESVLEPKDFITGNDTSISLLSEDDEEFKNL